MLFRFPFGFSDNGPVQNSGSVQNSIYGSVDYLMQPWALQNGTHSDAFFVSRIWPLKAFRTNIK